MVDGKFQTNAGDNGFVQRTRGLLKVGVYSESLADYPIDFTSVDEYNIYHLYNPNTYTLASFSRKLLRRIRKVTQSEFDKALKARMDDSDIAVLAFYNSIASVSKNIPISNEFTVNELQKLGFCWSKEELRYLRFLKKIQ